MTALPACNRNHVITTALPSSLCKQMSHSSLRQAYFTVTNNKSLQTACPMPPWRKRQVKFETVLKNSTEKGKKVRGGIKIYIRMVCFLLLFFSRAITSIRSPVTSNDVSQKKPSRPPCHDNLSPKCWGMCKGRFPFNQPSWFNLPTLFCIVTRGTGIWIPALIQFEAGIDN